MKFKLDENLALDCAQLLRAAGHDALTVGEQSLSGTPDDILAEICRNAGRVLITADLDLSDLRHFPVLGTSGHIVMRLQNQSRDHQIRIMQRILHLLSIHPLNDRLWIVTETKIRVRSRLG